VASACAAARGVSRSEEGSIPGTAGKAIGTNGTEGNIGRPSLTNRSQKPIHSLILTHCLGHSLSSLHLGPLWKPRIPLGSSYLSWVKIPHRIIPGPNLPAIWKPTNSGRHNPTHPFSPGGSLPTSQLLTPPGQRRRRYPGLGGARERARSHDAFVRSAAPPLPPSGCPSVRHPQLPLFRVLVLVSNQPPPPRCPSPDPRGPRSACGGDSRSSVD
jgi:hypothetical protein